MQKKKITRSKDYEHLTSILYPHDTDSSFEDSIFIAVNCLLVPWLILWPKHAVGIFRLHINIKIKITLS